MNPDALLPASVRVHPLTRIEQLADESYQLVCHVDLRDRFGHETKVLGLFRVELYRPVGDPADGRQMQDAVWRVDLSDPAENAEKYDGLVTRTYVLYLAGLPEWAQAGAGASGGTIRVYVETAGCDGESVYLQGSTRLAPMQLQGGRSD